MSAAESVQVCCYPAHCPRTCVSSLSTETLPFRQVVVRCRPLNEKEKLEGATGILKISAHTCCIEVDNVHFSAVLQIVMTYVLAGTRSLCA
jgi:hypothetical protein